ncbi:MAG: hypothetical protein ACAI44_34090, partial [Candidatus Sericytochromatia bacterium]
SAIIIWQEFMARQMKSSRGITGFDVHQLLKSGDKVVALGTGPRSAQLRPRMPAAPGIRNFLF